MADAPIPKAIIRGDLPAYTGPATAPPPGAIVIPTYTMYSGGQMALATFLGTPIAGCWLLARNFKRLQRPTAARLSLLLGVAWSLALLAIAFIVPALNVMSLVSIGLMSWLGYGTQGTIYHHHLRLGGRRGSWWLAVATGLVALVAMVALIFGAAVAYAIATEPSKLDFGDSEVYYDDGATEEQARAVGDLMIELEFFSATNPATVIVRHGGNRPVVSFFVKPSTFTDRDQQERFHEIANKLSTRVFDDRPVDIWLLEDYEHPKLKLSWEDRPMVFAVGKDEVWSQGGATEAEARAVGTVLTARRFFTDVGQTVMVRRHGRVTVAFVVFASAAEDDDQKKDFHRYAYWISQGAFSGAPVDVQLIDSDRELLASLAWESRPDDPVDLGDGRTISYRDGATVDEARAVANILHDASTPPEIIIAHYEDRVFVELLATDRTVVDATLHSYADKLSEMAFGGRAVDIVFVDAEGNTVADLEWEKRPRAKQKQKQKAR